jgi:molybdate transport system substrate-binding protein
MPIRFRSHAAAVLLLCGLTSSPVWSGEVSVAVASNFASPMERIVPLFQKESGHTVKVTLGASGKLYAQIKGGTPLDAFLSADEEMPKRLLQEGLAVSGSRFVYAIGRLVLWSAQPELVDDKGAVLNKGNFNMLAIANPRFSPYGTAAKETLGKLTMWNSIQEKLAKGESVTETYQLAATEKTDLAFISLAQVMRNGKVSKGSWWLVPSELHNPIRQSAVLLNGAKEKVAAKEFLAFLKSAKAKTVMLEFGYELARD